MVWNIISDNEIQWLTREGDFTAGVEKIRQIRDIPLILVSMGKAGSRAYYKDYMVEAAPFLQENTIETTGAGDTFCSNVLNFVLEHVLENLTEEDLSQMLRYANGIAGSVLVPNNSITRLRVAPRGTNRMSLL